MLNIYISRYVVKLALNWCECGTYVPASVCHLQESNELFGGVAVLMVVVVVVTRSHKYATCYIQCVDADIAMAPMPTLHIDDGISMFTLFSRPPKKTANE